MSEKTFHRMIAAVCIVGVLVTVGLVIYTYHLHDVCSILTFIANERG